MSIIISVYNTEKTDKCINSIINQTYKNIEIILVNDASTDSSLEICKKYQKIASKIIVKIQKKYKKCRIKVRHWRIYFVYR